MTSDPAGLFEAEVAVRCPALILRAEESTDAKFLTALFVSNSPLADNLPPFMLEQQAKFQQSGFLADSPQATRWIILRQQVPVGRIMIDWHTGSGSSKASCRISQCIDLALVPSEQGAGLGTQLLKAWVAVSDRIGLPASLHVRADHGARQSYERLGFVLHGDPFQPAIEMRRRLGG